MTFRKLKANEIDCRVAQCTAKGVSLLLYKDARVDQNILDETVGCMNWQRSHTRDNANCIVSIWDEDKKQWVSKEDTGTESNTEKEKGLASDSFKRACFNWGIGRELYSAPFIWIPSDKCKIVDKGNNKWGCNDRFTVSNIAYDDNGDISALTIKNGNAEVFTMGRGYAKPSDNPTKISALKKLLENNHIPEPFVNKLYKVASLEELTDTQYNNIVKNIDKIYDKYADEVKDGE